MNFRIIKLGAMTRREILRSVFRWMLYALLMLVFYTLQCTLPFFKWQPLLVIALACAVSFFEGELSGVIFAAAAGMVHDLALGGLFGFTSIWLIPCCLLVTLLVVNLIHRNIINFMWMSAAVLIIIEFMELLFKHIIWRNPDIGIIVTDYMLPSLISTIVLAVPIYFIVRFIYKKLGYETTDNDIITAFDDMDEEV